MMERKMVGILLVAIALVGSMTFLHAPSVNAKYNGANLSVEVVAPYNWPRGKSFRVTVIVRNTGSATATNVQVSLGWDYGSKGLSFGTLKAGKSVAKTVTISGIKYQMTVMFWADAYGNPRCYAHATAQTIIV